MSVSVFSMISPPDSACVLMTSNSSGVSLPGLFSTTSEILILPMSWSGAALYIRFCISGVRILAYSGISARYFTRMRRYSLVRLTCCPVKSSLDSTISAKLMMILF